MRLTSRTQAALLSDNVGPLSCTVQKRISCKVSGAMTSVEMPDKGKLE